MRRLERRLLAVMDKIGTRTPAGREYFRDAPFSIACYQASNLDRVQRKACCCGDCVDPVDVHTSVQVVGEPLGGPESFSAVEVDLRLSCNAVIRASFSDGDLGPQGQYPLQPGDEFEVEIVAAPRNRVWTAYVASIPACLA